MKPLHHLQQTSLLAFHSLDDLSARQSELYRALQAHGPATNLDLADVLHWPINSVTPRMVELRAKGMARESHKDVSRQTGRPAIYWVAVEGGPW